MGISYIVQDRWKDNPWVDHHTFSLLSMADQMLAERQGNPIWDGEGNRKWRIVERTVTDRIMEDKT